MNKKNKIGIWGLGIVGKSAIRYFSARGYTVEIIDQRTLTPQEYDFLAQHKVLICPYIDLNSFLERNDYILPSCGIDIRPYHMYAHKWLSELDLFAQECTAPIIAITGSVGKTTVTHLLSRMLAHYKKVFMGGNIGIGLLDSIEQANAADYVILEVSSFQLERCRSFAPHIALWTNIHANHLDRHGSLQAYINAKLHIIRLQKNNAHALLPLSLFEHIPADIRTHRPLHFFTASLPTANNIALMGDLHTLYYLHNSRLIMNYQKKDLVVFDFKQFTAVSYEENILIIAATIHQIGISLDALISHLQSEEIPEHRLEKLGTIHTIDFYNDSKATIPASTLAALEKIKGRPIILFLGGISKGIDRTDFIRQIAGKVRLVYCFGKEAEHLKTTCSLNGIQALSYATLDQAFQQLPQCMLPHDQILFSPAGASFDLYANYQERGNHFKSLVNEFKKDFNDSGQKTS
jgi:UDP-N-acetylmuramoylalanine--D-glutamate ligase